MRQTAQPHVPVGNKPQNLWLQKPVGVVAGGDTPSLTGEIIGETHRVLEHTNQPTQESAPEGPNFLAGSGGSDKTGRERSKQHWSLLDSSPTYSVTTQQRGLPCPNEH